MNKLTIGLALATLTTAAGAQSSSQEVPTNVAVAAQASSARAMGATGRTMPANTMVVVTPLEEITSKRVEKGQKVAFSVVNDVVEGGAVVIPRGTPVEGEIVWKTGRAIGGKSGKFEVEFRSLSLNGRNFAMRGKHRQEGRGNTVGALLGSIVISGRSAVMIPGQLVNAFTAEPVTY